MTTVPLRRTGIDFVGDVPWGTHFCHFFETKDDLVETLLPYFKAGLEQSEFCLWLVAEPTTTGEAINALRRAVPDLERYEADRSIEVHQGREWYLNAGAIDLRGLIGAWEKKLAEALDRGFLGMRVNGSPGWLQRKDWQDFCEYEERFNEWVGDKRIVASCAYPLAATGAAEVLDVARMHNFALAKRNGKWEVVETPEFREAKADIKRLNEELQRRVVERTAQLGAVNEELRARNRQQSAVAALGQTAIRSRDLAALLKEATAITAEMLRTDFGLVGEWLPGAEGFRLRAGVGWREGFIGSTIAANDALMGAYMLRSDEPVVVADVRAESRFAVSPMALEHGVVSGMGVVVRGRSGPWGGLAVHSPRPRSFSPDEIGFLQSVANVLSLAVERHEVEVAQRREKETLQAIFDNIPVMISSYDASGRLSRVNREWERTLGWTLADAQRVDILAEAYPDPEDRKRAEEFIRRAERRWADFRMRTRSGRVIDTSWARFALSDGSRIGFGLDITERKEAEAAQRGEKETLQAIFDNIPVMISITDASEQLSRVNREWERTLGWTLEEAKQVDLLTNCYPDPESREEVLEFYRRVQSRWADFRMRTRDRRVIESSWACFDISDGSRISLGLDISERKRAEEALRESEGRFRQLAESINEVFWLVTLDNTEVLYVSPVYERVFGRSRESLYRDPRSWLEAVHPEDRERVQRAADEKGARGKLDETYRVVRADGSIRWIHDQGFPIRDASGRIYRYAGIAEDVTDRRRAEEERAALLESESKARAEAEAALERLHAIQSITDLALARLALDDLLSELLARLRKALGGDFAFIQLIDEKYDSLSIRAADGVALNLVIGVRVPIGEAVAGRIAADGRPRIVYDLSTTDVSRIEGLPPELRGLLRGSMLGTPLQVEGRVIGVVSVASERPRRFTEEDLRLLQVVADRAAPAIERCRLAEAVRASGEQLKALSRRLLTAQEEERRRLAVELHDELGQVLTAVKINLASLERQAGAATAPAHLMDAIASVDRAMESVRDLALDLRPSVLDDLGLHAAVRWYADRFARTTHIDVHLSVDAVPHLPSELEIACFRVAQEALTNVARHAQARNVWVDLHLVAEALDLRVRDDGIGFDAGVARERAIGGASMGLLGMQERISLAGGEYELSTRPGGGTEVRARLPLGGNARGTP
jgi:PAS domain S-box-containing protein